MYQASLFHSFSTSRGKPHPVAIVRRSILVPHCTGVYVCRSVRMANAGWCFCFYCFFPGRTFGRFSKRPRSRTFHNREDDLSRRFVALRKTMPWNVGSTRTQKPGVGWLNGRVGFITRYGRWCWRAWRSQFWRFPFSTPNSVYPLKPYLV